MPRSTKNIEEQLLAENPDLRAEGLRPEVVWVKDGEDCEFEEAWKRQIRAINESPEEREILDWIERVADWPKDRGEVT